MSTDGTQEAGLSDRLNGVTIDSGLKELFGYIRTQTDKDGKIVKDPNTERAERTNRLSEGLQKIVEESLSGATRANEATARVIVNKLAYELAKTHGYHGKPEALTEERKLEYLSTALNAIGVPGVVDPEKFVASIMDMARPSSKPNDPLYDANSALVQFIQYIARRTEKEESRMNYLLTLINGAYQHPDKAMKIQGGLRQNGIKVGPTATITQLNTAIREYQAGESRKYVDSLPKTYQPKEPAPAVAPAH